jgi:predicted nuclease with RNAse H fold
MNIIGIDCATENKKIGIVFSKFIGNKWTVTEISQGLNLANLTTKLRSFSQKKEETLIALDAPLGFPINLGKFLSPHKAGVPITNWDNGYKEHISQYVDRYTDRKIREKLNLIPLSVGADKISRVTFRTMELIGTIEKELGEKLNLIWKPEDCKGISFIEVYPASTLKSYGQPHNQYKQKKDDYNRNQIIDFIISKIDIDKELVENFQFESKIDALDALICAFTGKEFIKGNLTSFDKLIEEKDLEEVKNIVSNEGWIWTKLT